MSGDGNDNSPLPKSIANPSNTASVRALKKYFFSFFEVLIILKK